MNLLAATPNKEANRSYLYVHITCLAGMVTWQRTKVNNDVTKAKYFAKQQINKFFSHEMTDQRAPTVNNRLTVNIWSERFPKGFPCSSVMLVTVSE